MTTPHTPPPEDDRLKRHLEKGGRVTLDVRQTFTAAPATLAAPEPLTIQFPGTEGLDKRLAPDLKVRANLGFSYADTPNFAILVFINTPNANARTATSVPGFLGSVAFFDHGHGEHQHADVVSRLSATPVVKRAARPGPMILTLVPVALPERAITAQTIQVSASVDLLLSKVEKAK